jgi:hypothetical protein
VIGDAIDVSFNKQFFLPMLQGRPFFTEMKIIWPWFGLRRLGLKLECKAVLAWHKLHKLDCAKNQQETAIPSNRPLLPKADFSCINPSSIKLILLNLLVGSIHVALQTDYNKNKEWLVQRNRRKLPIAL